MRMKTDNILSLLPPSLSFIKKGCSSILALFVENGPCSVNEFGNGTLPNPYSWNSNANILWIDQPVGKGGGRGGREEGREGEEGRRKMVVSQASSGSTSLLVSVEGREGGRDGRKEGENIGN